MHTIEHSESTTDTKVYKTGCHESWPTPKDLHLDVEVRDENATIHCEKEEHVGDHKKRHVTFLADKNCTLIFDNGMEVFGVTNVYLTRGRKKTLAIGDLVGRNQPVSTHCEVEPQDRTKRRDMHHHSPPKIEVP